MNICKIVINLTGKPCGFPATVAVTDYGRKGQQFPRTRLACSGHAGDLVRENREIGFGESVIQEVPA